MASSVAAAAATASTTAPLPLDAAPFLVAEVGGSKQTQYDLYELTNAFVSGQITARSLIYRPDLTGREWLPVASSHPSITAALAIPYIPPPTTTTTVDGINTAPSPSTSAIWYYIDSQRQRAGPVTADTLHALHTSGRVTDATLVWHDGLTEWLAWKQAALATKTAAISKRTYDDDEKEGNGSEEDEEHNSKHTTLTDASDSNTAEAHSKKTRKKRKKPSSANTAIYVTGLPSDITVEEAATFFKKAGVIREDIKTSEKRIKLYMDEETGAGKGDATVNYMFNESVQLAVTLLDGADIRTGWPVKVSEAKFDHTAAAQHTSSGSGSGSGVSRAEKRNKVETILAKRQKAVATSWHGDDSTFHSPLPAAITAATTNTALGLRIVVLSHLFTPTEAVQSADEYGTDSFFEELTSDIGEELEEVCGSIDKMTVYEHNEDGVVVVKFKTVEAAEKCVRVMRGRRFGGREIGVEWWDGRDYSVRETVEQEKQRLDAFAAALEGDDT